MKRALIALLLIISFLQAGITFGTGSKVNFGNANVGVYGSLKNQGTITYLATSKLSFVGSALDTLTNIYTFPNLIVNKPAGNLRLNNSTNNFLLTGNITFTQGNLYTGTNTFELGTSATVTGETATKYISGTVKAARAVGTGSNTFGGIGYSLGTGTGDLGTVTVYRYSGDGSEVNIYGTEGIWRKWTVQTSNAFSGTRTVTSSWLSNEDNANNLLALKVWKYEPVKSGDDDTDNISSRKAILNNKNTTQRSKNVEGSERALAGTTVSEPSEEDIIETEAPKTLNWVEVDGATFNTAASPRTATYTVNAATSFTVCSASSAFADGAGTEANPYQIATLDQLNNVRNYLTAHFIQIANIDASLTSGWNSGAGWLPILNFSGKYNGDGHTVSNLFASRTGTNYVGLFGYTTAGSEIKDLGLENVNFTGGSYTAGFVGYSRGTVKNCYSKGQIYSSTGTYAGGFVGRTTTGNYIYDSYSYANVTVLTGGTTTYAAGFCGYHGVGPISRCYSTGSVQLEGGTNPTNKGFAGYSLGTVAGNFWNTETSGQTTTYGTTATGLTKNQMRTLSIFTNVAWDFQGESVNGVEDLWGINAVLNSGYPFLSWEGITHNPSPFAGGIGTAGEPFLVSNLTQLDAVRNFTSSYFIQTSDIDASATSGWDSGAGWTPIKTASPFFTGNYNGQKYSISGIYINRAADNQSLFGYISGANISNLFLTNVNITGNNYIGGLAGNMVNSSIITGCSVKGQLNASVNYVGGIAGYLLTSSVISNSFASVNVRGQNYAAGIAGRLGSASQTLNCYAMGTASRITGYTGIYFGGITAYNNDSKLLKCYSTVSVIYEGTTNPLTKGIAGGVTVSTNYEMADNFFDSQVSGQTSTSGVGTAKTTAEMKNVSTYTLSGSLGLTNPWDFVNNPNNDISNNDYWNIHTSLNSGYPYLNWEYRIPVEAPSNLVLTVAGTAVTITWNAVAGATGYVVYSSVNPYGTFTLDLTGTLIGTQWTGTLTGTRNFYYVTATNSTKTVPHEITVSASR